MGEATNNAAAEAKLKKKSNAKSGKVYSTISRILWNGKWFGLYNLSFILLSPHHIRNSGTTFYKFIYANWRNAAKPLNIPVSVSYDMHTQRVPPFTLRLRLHSDAPSFPSHSSQLHTLFFISLKNKNSENANQVSWTCSKAFSFSRAHRRVGNSSAIRGSDWMQKFFAQNSKNGISSRCTRAVYGAACCTKEVVNGVEDGARRWALKNCETKTRCEILLFVTKLNCALLHVASRGIRVVTKFLFSANNEMLFATFA